ncbi:MAG: hypothetical protein EOO57_04780 [Hymenobacter sp.]|nr:MAG: hypothetical protein EOO57_04780 [Hymenobacter sp.]
MARHLSEIQARTRLSLGKSIGQFLSRQDEVDYVIIKWLAISQGGDEKAYSLYYSEVIDEGSEGIIDLVELIPFDPDNSPVIEEFDTIEEALHFATVAYGALLHRYVTESMVSDEYADYLQGLARRGQ